MSEQTFEAESVEAALKKAAAALGVDAAELEHEVVEKKQDFWGGGDSFVIKAWQPAAEPEEPAAPEPEDATTEPVAAQAADEDEAGEEVASAPPEQETAAATEEADGRPERAAAAPEDDEGDAEAESPAEASSDEDDREPEAEEAPRAKAPRTDDQAGAEPVPNFDPAAEGTVETDQVVGLLAQIFHDMEFDCTVEVEADDEGFSATVSGPDKEELLEGNGRCLSALELLVNNAFRNRMSRGAKIRVDAGDFRSRRDQELTDLAYQVAHSAKESGETQETQELNPYERRLVHLALAEDQAVTTKSRGSGFLKNVQVIPQDQGRGGRGRGRRR